MVEQFDSASLNVVTALAATGAGPGDLVSMQILVTDAAGYREALADIGEVWRRHFGTHYPAAALFEVSELFDPAALVELIGVAVVPS